MKYFFCLILALNIFAKEKIDTAVVTKMLSALEANESLHASYFKYNSEEVDKWARVVEKKLSDVKHPKLNDDLIKAKSFLGKINGRAKQEENNKNYHLASSYLIKLVNKYDFGPKYQAYYCPMVRKKWLQNVDKQSRVHNPYDSSMPHCGGRL